MKDESNPGPAFGSPVRRRRWPGPARFLGAAGAALLGACGSGSAAVDFGVAPRFADATSTSGIAHSYTGGFSFFVGGGVAAFDCDDDGFDDLFLAGGSSPAALYRNRTPDGGGELTFEKVPSPTTDLTDVTGAYPIDIDSDGIDDLVVLRRGEDVVLTGTGDCGFERANDRLGLDGGDGWTTGFSATWEPQHRLPTLAFGRYLVPDDTICGDSQLLRPDASGLRYGEPIALSPGYCTLSVLFSDWARDGRRDLRVTNDRHYYTDGQDQLWRIVADEPPRLYTADDGWQPLHIWGMGIASADVTNDGRPEFFLTSQGDNKLQTLATDATGPTFGDIALRRGVTAQRPFVGGDVLPSTAWHPEFADVNNDGLLDLFITKGNVEAQPDHAMRDPNNLLLQQADGTFRDDAEAAGIVDYTSSRGAALVDFDLDGLLDLVVVHRNAPVTIHHNVGSGASGAPDTMGHWIAVRLEQTAPNNDAIGAWIEVRAGDLTLSRELTVGGGHLGGRLGWAHFGLGTADVAQIRVQWPDGEVGPWLDVDADRLFIIERESGEAREWTPPGA